MAYQAALPNTGAILPVPGSGQAWEVAVYNGNFQGVEAAVAADRARLAIIEAAAVPQAAAAGLRLVKPTSVVAASGTATLNPDGSIVATNASTISLNGVFTSAFQRYRVVFDAESASVSEAMQVRMRAAGTDDSGNNYGYQQAKFSGSGLTAVAGTTTNLWQLHDPTGSAGGNQRIVLELSFPAQAHQTSMFGTVAILQLISAMALVEFAGLHGQATAYDGITLFPSAGTISGKLAVYAYIV